MVTLFLFLGMGLGGATHICPVHDAALAGAVEAGAAHDAGSHTGMAAHEQVESGQAHGDHQPEQGHAHCCCTGLACVTAAVTLPSHGPRLPELAIVASAAPELPDYARAAAAPAYFIPFANGPPTLSERSA